MGDRVFLKISPIRGVRRFGRRGKLSPRYIGSYEILARVGAVAYRLALPPKLSVVHPVFHVSMLHRYVPDPSHVLRQDTAEVEVDDQLSFIDQPEAIIARDMRKLRTKEIPVLKVR